MLGSSLSPTSRLGIITSASGIFRLIASYAVRDLPQRLRPAMTTNPDCLTTSSSFPSTSLGTYGGSCPCTAYSLTSSDRATCNTSYGLSSSTLGGGNSSNSDSIPSSASIGSVVPLISGRLPVIPRISRCVGSGSFSRKSTQVLFERKRGSSGSLGAFSKSMGITGTPRLANCLKYASISSRCQGPIPSTPTKTAAEPIDSICSSSSFCHGKPGRSSHSSSHGRRPSFFSFSAICLTAGLSLLL